MNLDLNWSALEAVGTISAAVIALFVAWFAIRRSNKQLEVEQTPYVILDHILRKGNRYGFSIKNIGKGPAVHITFSSRDSVSKRNEPFFSNDQNHSANFFPFEESHYWYTDGERLDKLKHDKRGFAYLYIFFENQSNDLFMTKTKIKRIDKDGDAGYVVMENKFSKLKGGVGA